MITGYFIGWNDPLGYQVFMLGGIVFIIGWLIRGIFSVIAVFVVWFLYVIVLAITLALVFTIPLALLSVIFGEESLIMQYAWIVMKIISFVGVIGGFIVILFNPLGDELDKEYVRAKLPFGKKTYYYDEKGRYKGYGKERR